MLDKLVDEVANDSNRFNQYQKMMTKNNASWNDLALVPMEVFIDGEGTRFYFFLHQKLKEILFGYSRIISIASKDS